MKSFGERSFTFMASSVWNSLLATLRNVSTLSQFISHLKTFLSDQAAFKQNLVGVSKKKKNGVSVYGLLNVDGCIWIGREWGGGGGGGGGGMRDPSKRRQGVRRVVVVAAAAESIDNLLTVMRI